MEGGCGERPVTDAAGVDGGRAPYSGVEISEVDAFCSIRCRPQGGERRPVLVVAMLLQQPNEGSAVGWRIVESAVMR